MHFRIGSFVRREPVLIPKERELSANESHGNENGKFYI